MDKKYELLKDQAIELDGHTLYRIRALRPIGLFFAGIIGGFVESEANLSHYNACWIGDDAWVYGDARVTGSAWVSANARIYGNAQIGGNAWVRGNACVGGNVWVRGNARVGGNAWIRRKTDYLTLGPIGSRNDFTTFYRTKDHQIGVACGCFSGSLDEFVERVKQVHGDSHHGKAYLLAADLARVQLKGGTEHDKMG